MSFKIVLLAVLAFGAHIGSANVVRSQTSSFDGLVDEMRANCDNGNDMLACMKFKFISFMDTLLKKDNYQIGSDIEVRENNLVGKSNEARSDQGLFDTIERYIQSHDVTFNVPVADAKVTVSPKSLSNDELNLNIKFNEGRSTVEGEKRSRKSKLKKILIPIMVFVLLKAMTLVPLALGVLGLKAFNALQLSFFSFIVSIALAIFQLCKKIAVDNHHPQIAAHGPWDSRSLANEPVAVPQIDDATGQALAYNAYF